MVGSAIKRSLLKRGCEQIVGATSAEVDLRDRVAATQFVSEKEPDVVIVAAAKVGGISANSTYPADFLYDNLMIACNLIHGISFLPSEAKRTQPLCGQHPSVARKF